VRRFAIRKPDQSELAMWGFVVGCLVAGIYFFQLRAMIEQNQIGREATEAVQRAFVYIDGFSITRQVNPDKPDQVAHILIAGNVKNSGVTPAIYGKYYINSRFDAPPPKRTILAIMGRMKEFTRLKHLKPRVQPLSPLMRSSKSNFSGKNCSSMDGSNTGTCSTVPSRTLPNSVINFCSIKHLYFPPAWTIHVDSMRPNNCADEQYQAN